MTIEKDEIKNRRTGATTTATEYADRYLIAFEAGTLTQGEWHVERDGRQLACMLGVLGDDIDDLSKCPAQIMPRWLAQMVLPFFDRQKPDDAFAWGLGFTAELARLNGVIPFAVIHDWHANTVCALGIDVAGLHKRDTAPHKSLQTLHLRALAGDKITEDEWRPVLKNVYADAHAYANAADDAADAYTNAYANAWKRLADGMTAALQRVEA